jgi:hypothetical protein
VTDTVPPLVRDSGIDLPFVAAIVAMVALAVATFQVYRTLYEARLSPRAVRPQPPADVSI